MLVILVGLLVAVGIYIIFSSLAAGPVVKALWSFEQNTSPSYTYAQFKDSSGNNNTLSSPVEPVYKQPRVVDGRINKAVGFNGGNYLTASNSSSLQSLGQNDSNFSVTFWFYLRQGPTGAFRSIMHKGNNDNQRTFAMWLNPNSNQIAFSISTQNNYNNYANSRAAIPINQWVQITYMKNGDFLELYFNGVLDERLFLAKPGMASSRDLVVSNNGPLYIGKDPWYNGVNAIIDELQLTSLPTITTSPSYPLQPINNDSLNRAIILPTSGGSSALRNWLIGKALILAELTASDGSFIVQPIPGLAPSSLVDSARKQAFVEAAMVDAIGTGDDYGSYDPEFTKQRYLSTTYVTSYRDDPYGTGVPPSAWNFTKGNPNVAIAILDDGIDPAYEDEFNFDGQGKNYSVSPDGEPYKTGPNSLHGTVEALIAAGRDNGKNGVGVCPDCSVRPYKIGDNNKLRFASMKLAINDIIRNPGNVKVVLFAAHFDMQDGTNEASSVCFQIHRLYELGISYYVSGGQDMSNGGGKTQRPGMPQRCGYYANLSAKSKYYLAWPMVVGASDYSGKLASFSDGNGPSGDPPRYLGAFMIAPGIDVNPGNGTNQRGTSAAVAQVAGAAGLVISQLIKIDDWNWRQPLFRAAGVMGALELGSLYDGKGNVRPGDYDRVGTGMLNAGQSLSAFVCWRNLKGAKTWASKC
jgi:hypothetical protein